MSTVSKITDFVDPTVSQNDMCISFWGLCCVNGKQYSQVVKRRFRLTKAVLDPDSYSKDDKNKTVKVNIMHRGCDYLLCILKHEEIYQVSLNLMFDKGENVIFFIEGLGKVYLSGYEVNDSINEVPWDESISVDLTKEVKTSSPRKSTPTQSSSKFKVEAGSSKSERKAKSARKVPPDERKGSPKPYLSALFNGEINDDEDDDDEDDEDFTVEEETESDGEETESEDEEIDESEIEEEAQALVELVDEELRETDEDVKISEPTVSQKRKRQMLAQQPVKRTKKDSYGSCNTSAVDNDVIICEDDSEESSDSGSRNTPVRSTPISKHTPTADSAEKKKKKKKKKKKLNESSGTVEQMGKSSKSPSSEYKVSSKKFQGGVEVHDLIVGRGPVASIGRLLHIFYVGRLENKEIFDSRVPGKKPLGFRLGKNTVIRGLDVGLEGMKVGGKRKIIVPPSMGYGSAQVDSVPPNSTLEFTVELQAVS